MVIYSIKDDTITLRDESAVVSYNLSPQGGGTSAKLVTGHLDPSTSVQTLNAPAEADGFSSVSIDPVTAAIDPDIVPENIVEGVSILGVEGTAFAFPDFSELGYNATESVHAFTAWLDKKSWQYDDMASMLQGLRQDIQASVKYFADQGITKDSDYSFNFVRTGGEVYTTFMIKTATPYITGNGNDIAITSSSDIIYYPMLKVKLPTNSAAMRIMRWLNFGSYYEGFVFEKQDETPASVHTVSWADIGGAYLFNDFNQVFYDCLESGGSYGKSLIFRNVTCFFWKHSVNIPKAADTSEMFRDCIFAKGFDGSIYLPAATDTHDMFRNCRWQEPSYIRSISCPESLNASFMFYPDRNNVDVALTIGPVSLPKALNVEQMFRSMQRTHVEGPIDIHSCTDAENFFCWSEPSSCPVPDASFGPIDQNCFFFYSTMWPTEINNWDTSQIKNGNGMFGDVMRNLTSIGLLDLSSLETVGSGIVTDNGADFLSLADVAGFTGLKFSINFRSASKLTAESVANIITQAADCSALEAKPTLTLHADAYARVTEETKTLASTKGWTIAQA